MLDVKCDLPDSHSLLCKHLLEAGQDFGERRRREHAETLDQAFSIHGPQLVQSDEMDLAADHHHRRTREPAGSRIFFGYARFSSGAR